MMHRSSRSASSPQATRRSPILHPKFATSLNNNLMDIVEATDFSSYTYWKFLGNVLIASGLVLCMIQHFFFLVFVYFCIMRYRSNFIHFIPKLNSNKEVLGFYIEHHHSCFIAPLASTLCHPRSTVKFLISSRKIIEDCLVTCYNFPFDDAPSSPKLSTDR